MKERDASFSVKTLFDQLECKRNVWSVVNDGCTRLACTPSFKGHLVSGLSGCTLSLATDLEYQQTFPGNAMLKDGPFR
jgi:hypothetical protein